MAWELVDLVDELEDALPVEVEVERRATGAQPWIRLRAGGEALYRIRLARFEGRLVIVVDREADLEVGAEPDLAAALLVVLALRAGDDQVEVVELRTFDPVMRAQARRLGFSGELRGPLTRPRWADRSPGPGRSSGLTTGAGPSGAGAVASSDLVAALGELLPGVRIERRRSRGRLRTAAKSVETGLSRLCELDVALPDDARALQVVLADRPDVLVEPVALAIDTTLAVRRRFAAHGSCLRMLSFIQADRSYRNGRVAGMAHTGVGAITLNGGYVTPAGVLDLNRRRQARGSARFAPTTRSDPGFAPLDGVTAHECWHVIDGTFQLHRFPETIEFRRRLGRYFGVDTLEQALYGRDDRAPIEQRLAYQRLRDEVSAYATTRMGETTAEMFKLWWCNPTDPPPLVEFFGELLDEYFGVRR